MTSIRLHSRWTTRWLSIVLGGLLLLHLAVAFGHMVLHVRLEALTQLVDLDLEANLPTLFTVLLFFLAATLFLLHGRIALPRWRHGWYLMAVVFLFLGIDEGSQVHEKFRLITVRLLNQGSETGSALTYYAWAIPYVLALIVMAMLLLRWFLHLPLPLRKGLALSGCVYVFGAVLMEMAAGQLFHTLTRQDPAHFPWMPCEVYAGASNCWLYMEPRYVALYTLEEMGEMIGLILCIRALLKAFEADHRQIQLSLAEMDPGTPAS